jgi:RNA polymerase sigma-70 factor (ECF subfamily)
MSQTSGREPAAPGVAGSAHGLVEHLFRHRAGQMVATLARLFGLAQLDAIEDAVQEALVQALRAWPHSGVPDNPSAWLTQVARHRLLDRLRRGGVWRRKQASLAGDGEPSAPSEADEARFAGELPDDVLGMIFACCHPALAPGDRVALTLRTVGGFSVGEVAHAFLAGEAATAQRLVRAKQRLRERGVSLGIPSPEQLAARLDSVLEVLYLMFNEGYAASAGDDLVRGDLCLEALRLAELVAAHPATTRPDVHALAALFAFQASRLATRSDPAGELLLLEEQDRSRWDRGLVARGLAQLRRSARGEALSAYHLEAEIASCHALAPSWAETDWRRILRAYDELLRRRPSPVVAVNRAVALAQVEGPAAGLAALEARAGERALARYAPLHAGRGALLARLGRHAEARTAFEQALALTASEPVRRYLARRMAERAPGK